MQSTFDQLGLSADLVSVLADRSITSAFPVQEQTIPAALAGRDVCGKAPTGSGKTLAFGLPLVERVERARPNRPKALILAPTRELAAQIADELEPLLKRRKRSVASFYGGVGFGNQLKALRKGVDVAVACPGRLADLINQGNMHLSDVQIVVVDEADRMADMGFLPEVRRILDQTSADRQTLLFSATLDGDVDVLIRNYQRNPERCEVEPEPVDDRTEHHFVETPREKRVELTASLVAEHGTAIVFTRTKHGADRLARQLEAHGIRAAAIHGDRSQSQRERALAAFAGGRVEALVATDVAARGIHVNDVGLVVHFDPPADEKDYTHRSGRTGRAGADGTVVLFVTDADRSKVKVLRRKLGFDLKGRPSVDAMPKAPVRPVTASVERTGPRKVHPPRPNREGTRDTWNGRAAPEERPEQVSGARGPGSGRDRSRGFDRPRENRDERPARRERGAGTWEPRGPRTDRPQRPEGGSNNWEPRRSNGARPQRPTGDRTGRPQGERQQWEPRGPKSAGAPKRANGAVARSGSEADRRLDAASRDGQTRGPRRTTGYKPAGKRRPR